MDDSASTVGEKIISCGKEVVENNGKTEKRRRRTKIREGKEENEDLTENRVRDIYRDDSEK